MLRTDQFQVVLENYVYMNDLKTSPQLPIPILRSLDNFPPCAFCSTPVN